MTVESLLRALPAAEDKHKRELIRQLGETHSPAAIPALSGILRDQTTALYLRRLAAVALGEIGDSRGCLALVTVLDEPARPDARLIPRMEKLRHQLQAQLEDPALSAAQQASVQQQLAEIESVIRHDGDMMRLLKLDVIRVLGDIGFVLALQPLQTIIKAGQDAEFVVAAEQALAQVHEKSGLEVEEAPPEPEPVFVYKEYLTCSKCSVTSETGLVRRCHNCRLPVCAAHSVEEVGLVFCSSSCLDSFADQPGNWVYWT